MGFKVETHHTGELGLDSDIQAKNRWDYGYRNSACSSGAVHLAVHPSFDSGANFRVSSCYVGIMEPKGINGRTRGNKKFYGLDYLLVAKIELPTESFDVSPWEIDHPKIKYNTKPRKDEWGYPSYTLRKLTPAQEQNYSLRMERWRAYRKLSNNANRATHISSYTRLELLKLVIPVNAKTDRIMVP
jgi:hypothetical protein